MAQVKRAQKQFDVIIVGAGLSGLLLANKAKSIGKSVALIEAQDTFGGFHHPSIATSNSHLDNSLHFISGSDQNTTLVRKAEEHFHIQLNPSIRASQVLTFEDGQVREFTGFGKLTPEFFDEIVPYLTHQELSFSNPWSALSGDLANSLGDSLYLNHLASELVIEDRVTQGVMVNGSHFWKAAQVIFAGGIGEVLAFLPPSFVSARLKNHLKRLKLWTLVAVDFTHASEVTASYELHVLNGTTQDDIGPCLGRFFQASEGRQVSQWLSFASDEDADESENIGAIIKKMKRQIKRAYPTAFEGQTSEKIVVIPSGAGHFEDIQVLDNVYFKDLQGFYLASSHLSPQTGVLKALDQALRVSQHLNWGLAIDDPTVDNPTLDQPNLDAEFTQSEL